MNKWFTKCIKQQKSEPRAKFKIEAERLVKNRLKISSHLFIGMPTYQIIAPKRGGARLTQQEFQACIQALQAKQTLEKQYGCTLLSYAWSANATTCFMIVDSKSHFGLSAFLSKVIPSTIDLDLKVEALVTMQEMQQALYQVSFLTIGGFFAWYTCLNLIFFSYKKINLEDCLSLQKIIDKNV
ncbi:hypothetical protein RFI_17395 [Reticulomyxa filosa]|uniref:Uncharacterized protein n=1 Tax=Reticulomyxa filosa TaxID=46433 RepID=X6N3F0_RETFI|nr:hypothetical protein RFI_17395 [Reticulomyxa filosa]|eukprot:ETO19832.1 hypothetical protein RFI_17395 [Reticulomyxa filosa]